MCESHDGDRLDIGPCPSAGENREGQWDPEEAEAGHKEDRQEDAEGNGERDDGERDDGERDDGERDDGERDDGDTPLPLRSSKKRPVLRQGKSSREALHQMYPDEHVWATALEMIAAR